MWNIEKEIMTIIAVKKFDDRIEIAGDGRVIGCDLIISDNDEKIIETDTYVLAASGAADICNFCKKALAYYTSDIFASVDDYSDFIEDLHRRLNVSYTGSDIYIETIFIDKVYKKIYRSLGFLCHEIYCFAAIGKGTDMALGALESGASPSKAVEIVCKYYPSCGGKIIEKELPLNKEES